MAQGTLIVLYDRDCALCVAIGRWLRRADAAGRLEFRALQDAPADARLAEVAATHPLHAALHTVDAAGRVSAGGAALLDILERLPGGPISAAWRRLPFAPALAEAACRSVASQRERIGAALGLDATCDIEP